MNFNKLGLVVLSAGAIFMATSCNKPNTKIDSEEEFENAVSLKDVAYLQVNTKAVTEMADPFGGDERMKTTDISKQQLAPNTFYSKGTTEESEGDSYAEIYSTAKDNVVTYIIRTSKGGEFSDEQTIQMSDPSRVRFSLYFTPQEIGEGITGSLYGLKFKDFDYKNGAYVKEYSAEGTTATFSFSFANKKMVKFKMTLEMSSIPPVSNEEEPLMSMSTTCTFSYSKITPSNPKK